MIDHIQTRTGITKQMKQASITKDLLIKVAYLLQLDHN